MIKSDKGISLLSLVITIVIMTIIASVTINTSKDRYEINNINKMINDIKLLEDKVSNYYLRYNAIPVVRDVDNNIPIEYKHTTISFDTNINDDEVYYILDLAAMPGITLNYGQEGFENINQSDDVYIINNKTHHIYYVRGIELDGVFYHSMLENNKIADKIPPSKPEIKIISGKQNEQGVYTTEVAIEIIPGRDSASGIDKTTYSINGEAEEDISTLANNILRISDNGTYNIKVRSYDKGNNVSEYVEIDINVENEENRKYRFITKWNVTLGETEGSDTYSTVVLPVNSSSAYDAQIYWGDGTSTLLQHKTNGVTLTSAELTQKVTHNYTLAENDNAERTIEIEGTYTDFRMSASTSTSTKLKLTNIEQWGYIGVTQINFKDCTNLIGIVPNPNEKNSFEKCTSFQMCFQNTGIQGLEEGFSLPNNIGGQYAVENIFNGCKNLKSVPNSFQIPPNVLGTFGMFSGCSSLESLPESLVNPSSCFTMGSMFSGCSSLEKLPADFNIPSSVTMLDGIISGCNSLKELPTGFILPENYNRSLYYFFYNCKSLESLPDGFTIPKGVTNITFMFYGCSSLESLPDSFSIPESYEGSIVHMFSYCEKLNKIPNNFTIPEGVTNIGSLFYRCKALSGTIEILGNPTEWGSCFGGTASESGSTLTVNYSKNCTNIDNIIATGNSTYIIKAEQPID